MKCRQGNHANVAGVLDTTPMPRILVRSADRRKRREAGDSQPTLRHQSLHLHGWGGAVEHEWDKLLSVLEKVADDDDNDDGDSSSAESW